MKKSRNKIEMEKLKNPSKMNGIISDAAAETLSQFCMFSWRRKVSKFNFHGTQFLSHSIWVKSFDFLGKCGGNGEKSRLWLRFIVAAFILASLLLQSSRSKPINYSEAFGCWYSLANNVQFWQTTLHPMHISGPHWTSFGCVMESRHRRQPIPPCSTAIPNSVPWWNGLMNNERLQLTFKFIPSLWQGFPLFTAIQKGLKLTFHFAVSNEMQIAEQ